MPGKRGRPSRLSKKRRKTKSHTGMAAVRRGQLMNFPLQTKLYSTTRYNEVNLTLDPLQAIPDTYVFSLNGLYDPNITGVGHSALGFDQLKLMYDHYCVTRAKVWVTASNHEGTTSQIIVCQIKDTNTVTTDVDAIIENGRCVRRTIAPQGSGGCVQTLTMNCNLSRFFGRPVQYDNIFRGTATSNPGDQAFLHVTALASANIDPASIKLEVCIQYETVWTEPKILASS